MTTRVRRPVARRTLVISARPKPMRAPVGLGDLQKGWWLVALVAAGIGALGFQTLPPARRLAAVEAAAVRLDSVDGTLERRNKEQDLVQQEHQRTERAVLDSISRQLGQLLAGQCAKERDRMARLLYDCARRAP